MNFKDKVVLVTGSSRGIGRQIVYDFAKKGASVIINYNSSEDDAKLLEEEIVSLFGVSVMSVCCDVSDEESVKKMVSSVLDKFGRIDILVNNAGICNDTLYDEKSYDSFERVLGVNLIGTYLVSKYVCSDMLLRKSGKVINISSDNGLMNGYPESAEYDASKAGVISLTHNMAKFYAPYINVNCVCPGWVDTDMNFMLDESQVNDINSGIMLGRFGTVSEISNVVMFLASDFASYVNDSVICVNGGSL